ncbi:uncharacterized protein RAG0_15085 [Rhynchosporium agropyri]|uniref:Uncharacterized protein n=1 Tax=Rhynchosporium agropyri TaxID=914238 RepID=A0A1E1LJJ6_9HELO|nr:uncharacterized protein RAG0_15085 [Rhynchosporium agropyri]
MTYATTNPSHEATGRIGDWRLETGDISPSTHSAELDVVLKLANETLTHSLTHSIISTYLGTYSSLAPTQVPAPTPESILRQPHNRPPRSNGRSWPHHLTTLSTRKLRSSKPRWGDHDTNLEQDRSTSDGSLDGGEEAFLGLRWVDIQCLPIVSDVGVLVYSLPTCAYLPYLTS